MGAESRRLALCLCKLMLDSSNAKLRFLEKLKKAEERAIYAALGYSHLMVGETLKTLFNLSDEELKGRWVDFRASIGEVIYNSIIEATATIGEIASRGIDESNVEKLASALSTLLRTMRGMLILLAELTPVPKRYIIEYLATIFEAEEKLMEKLLPVKGKLGVGSASENSDWRIRKRD